MTNSFDNVTADYAERDAHVTERDHARLCEAIADGVIEVVRDI